MVAARCRRLISARVAPILAVGVAVVLLGTAHNAGAATVMRISGGGKDDSPDLLRFLALPGETNRVTVVLSAADPARPSITIHDAGAAVTGNCPSIDAHTVRCVAASQFNAELGDGNDTYAVSGMLIGQSLNVDGGPGNDRLTGGRVGRVGVVAQGLNGGTGNDRIVGGPYDDSISGGPGNDTLDGGPGADTARDADITAPASVDLGQGTSRVGPHEHDALSSIENVEGGPGVDVIKGTNGPNQLYASFLNAGIGGDVLIGRAGNDELMGLIGRPISFDGGPGDDSIHSGSKRDNISCGPGADRVILIAGGGVIVPSNCERIETGGLWFGHGHVANGRLVVAVSLPATRYNASCPATLTVGEPVGRVYGTAHFTVADPLPKTTLTLRLNGKGRRLARRHGLGEMHVFGRCIRSPVWRVRL